MSHPDQTTYRHHLRKLRALGITGAAVDVLVVENVFYRAIVLPDYGIEESPSAHSTAHATLWEALGEGIKQIAAILGRDEDPDFDREKVKRAIEEEVEIAAEVELEESGGEVPSSAADGDGLLPPTDKPEREFRTATELEPHPLLAQCWEMPEESEEFEALLASVQRDGVQHPVDICVTEEGAEQILDGRHRWRCAAITGDEFEVNIHDEGDAVRIILERNCLRKQYRSKSARAYDMSPIILAAIEAGQQQRAAAARNARAGSEKPLSGSTENLTLTDLAKQIGISLSMLKYAAQIRRWPASRRQPWEEKIMGGEVSLGYVINGEAGKQSTKGKRRKAPEPFRLIADGFIALGRRFSHWDKLADEQRAPIVAEAREWAGRLPDELKAAVKEELSA